MLTSYPEWRNFQFEPNNHYRLFFLHTLLSTITFRLEYVLFYQFYATITTFFRLRNVRFGSSLIRWRRKVWRKLTWKWHGNVKNDVKTSYWRHAGESSYTPHVRWHFLAPVGYARKKILLGYRALAKTLSPTSALSHSHVAATKRFNSSFTGLQSHPIVVFWNLIVRWTEAIINHYSDQKDHTKKAHVCHFCIAFKGCDFWLGGSGASSNTFS